MLRRFSYFLLLLPFLLFPSSLFAQGQEDTDSLVRLLGCDELRQEEEYGKSLRKALGHARFQHNGTLLICDTALWHVDDQLINAIGNVQIIQNETMLTSDNLDYFVNDNLAQFRGTLVQLQDKDANTLRTNNLDYNTKDSVAIFREGGSFRDKDGQIIESDNGTYDSKIKTFFFDGNVNMYTDSIFIKTNHLEYNTDLNLATFGTGTNAWQEENMLSAEAGWYDRAKEIFLFNRKVHLLTKNQEGWADTLKYYRNTKEAEMFGNVEILDTTRDVSSVAGYMHFIDSLSKIIMKRDPAVVGITRDSLRDTVYIGADTLTYWTVPKCTIPSEQFKTAKARLEELNQDAISAYRQKAAKEAAANAANEKKKMEQDDPNASASIDRGIGKVKPRHPSGGGPPGSKDQEKTPENKDSLEIAMVRDSLARVDSLAKAQVDSSKIGFVLAVNNVKVFKSDMQMSCDSLEYNDIDSLVRLYKKPIVWNEVRRQYTADSITMVIKNRTFDRASLMSNAFITIQEDSASYDQIKATDMMAYFDTSGSLRRFDAMGDVSGVFFIEENNALATVNKFESKLLTANFANGSIDNLNYFQAVKSDAYPVVQMVREDKYLKGFQWSPDLRPESPRSVTALLLRMPQRAYYQSMPKAEFNHTDRYFPGYMDGVYVMLANQDSLGRIRQARRDSLDRISAVREDSLAIANEARLDSLSRAIVLSKDTISAKVDSLDIHEAKDSLNAVKEAMAAKPESSPARKDSIVEDHGKNLSDATKAKPDEKKPKVDRAARRQARWDRLNKRDEEKAAKKAAKKQAKLRKKKLKTLQAMDKRQAKEQKMYEIYKARYEKQKARRDARKANSEPATDIQDKSEEIPSVKDTTINSVKIPEAS